MMHEGVHDLFDRAAARWGDAVAMERGGRRVSYAELEAESNRLARALVGAGLERGSRVAIVDHVLSAELEAQQSWRRT